MRQRIFKYICLGLYIVVAFVLIFESCLNGTASSNQSDAVGGGIADFVNGVNGDQAEDIIPTEIVIENQSTTVYVGQTKAIRVKTIPENSNHKSYIYYSSDESVAKVSQKGVVSFLKKGSVTITVVCKDFSELTDSVTFNVEKVDLEDFNISIAAKNENNVYQLVEGNSYYIDIEAIPSNASYDAKYIYEGNAITISSAGKIKALAPIEEIEITVQASSISKVLKVKVNAAPPPVITTKLDVAAKYYSYNDEVKELNLEEDINLRIGESIKLSYLLDSNTTQYLVSYSSSDKSIATVSSNGVIKAEKIGATDVTITEEASGISYTYTINVSNLIVIDFDNPITIEGLKHNDKVYEITNGSNGSVGLSFIEEASYTTTTYTSSNESVAEVGSDGTIIPKKVGTTTITLLCEDDDVKLEYELKLKVKPKPLITNLSVFLYQVRKGIGHFGAFLVLGIFSTLTFFLWFKPKRWFITAPVNLIQGFMIAAITEIIQLYVPGRYGTFSDVMLDFYGFLLSSILITIGFIVVFVIKKLKNKEKGD